MSSISSKLINLTSGLIVGTLSISHGGTNSSAALNNNRVMKSSGGAIIEAAAITASKALVSDTNGIPVAATTSTAELNFLVGVTSLVQTQFNALTDPVNASDSAATILGQKIYSHGTTYNGGIAPTITLASGGGTLSSVQQGEFTPKKMQDGSWRCVFNVDVTVSSTSRSNVSFAVNGLTFYNSSGGGQPITGYPYLVGTSPYYSVANPGAGTFNIAHAAASSTEYAFSGDVKLASKPTWAY